jgi:hypothetical protein
MKKPLFATLFMLAAVTAQAVNLTSIYSEDFNSMGTGSLPPAGWSFYGVYGGSNSTFTDSIAIAGASVVGGTLNNTLTAATTFTTASKSNTSGFNLALPASASDRSLGTSPTDDQFVALQLNLTNTSGGPLNGVYVGYDTRRFTVSGGNNELPGFWLFYSLDNGISWTNVPAFNPTISRACRTPLA